ncbi:DUF2975 domain-containing protein [Coxiella burnetii]|uniref:DUF2975 domain-containing protein n=1 Tax=Coxiella burnetii (strain Dugway 5J108-111) TaxID=434922 RepID=B5XHA7_COXBN|nr:DUF2975 domain-containing protein [Coxiella burnetii]ACI23127.1 hypothetical protein CBUD_0785c [Coxiella burnetii Dugway 5J108-111]
MENVKYYRQLGYTFFLWIVGRWVYHLVIFYFFSPPDKVLLIFVFINLTNIISFFIGAIIILISWIMKEGYLLKEDYDFTI